MGCEAMMSILGPSGGSCCVPEGAAPDGAWSLDVSKGTVLSTVDMAPVVVTKLAY